MTPLILRDVLTSATTYRLRPAEGFGWANCTVNDATGELAITSDWGNWSYMWGTNPHSLGCATLTHFLGTNRSNGTPRVEFDYFAMKLLGRAGGYRFSVEKTTAHFRKKLCARRFETSRGDLTHDLARELWDALGSLEADISGDDRAAETLYIERFLQIEDHTFLSDEPWHELQHETSPEYIVLTDRILPGLAAACYERVTASPVSDNYRKLQAEFEVESKKRHEAHEAKRIAREAGAAT